MKKRGLLAIVMVMLLFSSVLVFADSDDEGGLFSGLVNWFKSLFKSDDSSMLVQDSTPSETQLACANEGGTNRKGACDSFCQGELDSDCTESEENQACWLCEGVNELPASVELSAKAPKSSISYEDFVSVLNKEILAKSSLSDEALIVASNKMFPKGTILDDGSFSRSELLMSSYLAWIDPTPQALYAHPTFYIYLWADKTLEVREGAGWAVVDGAILAETGTVLDVTGAEDASGSVPIPSLTLDANSKPRRKVYELRKGIKMFDLPTTPSNPKEAVGGVCPDGQIAVEVESDGKEVGKAFSVVGQDAPRFMKSRDSQGNIRIIKMFIDFEGEAKDFGSAVSAGKFVYDGEVKTPQGLVAKLAEYGKSLKRASSMAMFMSAHGGEVYETTLTTRGGETKVFRSVGGLPKGISQALPSGATLGEKKKVGFCFALGPKNQCVIFNPDEQLGPISSCRKVLASNSCYSGSLTKNSVKGLYVYAGSKADEPGRAYQSEWKPSSGSVGLTWAQRSLFGELFVKALKANAPKDPEYPQKEDPIDKFEDAWKSVSANIVKGQSAPWTVIGASNQEIKQRVPVLQTATRGANLHEKNCKSSIKCVPLSTWVPPRLPPYTDPRFESSCADLMSKLNSIPAELQAMNDLGLGYPNDNLQVLTSMLQSIDKLKKCLKCPPGESITGWSGCDFKPIGSTSPANSITGIEALEGFAAGIKKFGQDQFKDTSGSLISNLANFIKQFAKCKPICSKRPITGLQPSKTNILIPGAGESVQGDCSKLGVAEIFGEPTACKKFCTYGTCKRVRVGEVTIRSEREKAKLSSTDYCYMCRAKDQESVIPYIGGFDGKPKTSVGGTPDTSDTSMGGGAIPIQQDCNALCSGRDMLTSRQPSSYFFNQVQSYTCVSGATVKTKIVKSGECVCYSQKLTVNTAVPKCPAPCGNVNCGSSLKCGDTTYSCNWGGWVDKSSGNNYAFVASTG